MRVHITVSTPDLTALAARIRAELASRDALAPDATLDARSHRLAAIAAAISRALRTTSVG